MWTLAISLQQVCFPWDFLDTFNVVNTCGLSVFASVQKRRQALTVQKCFYWLDNYYRKEDDKNVLPALPLGIWNRP